MVKLIEDTIVVIVLFFVLFMIYCSVSSKSGTKLIGYNIRGIRRGSRDIRTPAMIRE